MSATYTEMPWTVSAMSKDQARKMTQFASDKLRMAKALKATRTATDNVQHTSRSVRGYASNHPRLTGGMLAAVMSSPALYHGTVKVAATLAKAAVSVGTAGLHLTSIAIGTVGVGAASLVGYLFPAGGKFIRSLTNSVTSLITNTALSINSGLNLTIDVAYSTLVSPTVTSAVVRSANAISWLMFVQWVTRGASAKWLVKVPVVGPYLAAVSLGGRYVYLALRTVLVVASAWGWINRPAEMTAVLRGETPAPSFQEEIKRELRIKTAVDEMISEAEQMLAEQAEQDTTEATEAAEEIIELVHQADADLAEADAILADLRRPGSNNPNRNRNRNRRRAS